MSADSGGGDLDTPLPLDINAAPVLIEQEPEVSALPAGSTVRIPELRGRWSVWSQSDESPGAHFIVPLDDEAHGMGVKYAVVRAKVPRGSSEAILTLLRTDPSVAGLGLR